MTDKEVIKQALYALLEIEWSNNSQWQADRATVAIQACRSALAQPEQKQLAQIKEIRDIQGSNGNWNSSPYGHGLYNGIEMALSILEERDPIFFTAPENGYCNNQEVINWKQPAPAVQPLTADDLKEPKNGEQWRVEWWNEACRMMLPSDAVLDKVKCYPNGTIQFTIKKAAHGIGAPREDV